MKCSKCRGRGEIDMNVCHGFGRGPRTYWPCTACGGTGRAPAPMIEAAPALAPVGEFVDDQAERERLMRDTEADE